MTPPLHALRGRSQSMYGLLLWHDSADSPESLHRVSSEPTGVQ